MKYRYFSLITSILITSVLISTAFCYENERFSDIQRIALEEGNKYTVSSSNRLVRDWACYPGIGCTETSEEFIREKITEFNIDQIVLPKNWDWRSKRVVSEVQDQGNWGNCWAFAATSVVESAHMISKFNNGINLSEQDLINCNQYGFSGTNGWATTRALDYFIEKGGIKENQCTYSGEVKACMLIPHPYKIKNWKAVKPEKDQIKAAIFKYGPVWAFAAADEQFEAYSGGVFNHKTDGPLNHSVVIVGWDDRKGENGCWIVKNSHGKSWGENGYMYCEYGAGSIGTDDQQIGLFISYAVCKDSGSNSIIEPEPAPEPDPEPIPQPDPQPEPQPEPEPDDDDDDDGHDDDCPDG